MASGGVGDSCGSDSGGAQAFAGFVDVQVNGYKGVSFSDPSLSLEACISTCEAILSEGGCAAIVPTVITCPLETYDRVLPILAAAAESPRLRGRILGLHLEGPFISPRKGAVGAHPPLFVRTPRKGGNGTGGGGRGGEGDEGGERGADGCALLDRWQRLARGRIKLITIAAEAEGADRLCAHAVRMGVRVSLGHMMAVGDEIGRLAAAGATHLTHLGNGCPNEVHRHKNHLWPCLADDRLCAMIITDGQHLPADTISAILRCKGVHNTIVTSDVAPVAGLDEGSYECFGSFVHVQGKFVRSADKSCLAGSGALMLDCLNHLASLGLRPAPGRDESLSLDELLMLAFDNPIRALGLEPTAVAADLHSLGPSRVLHEAGRFRLVGKVYCDPCAAAAPG